MQKLSKIFIYKGLDGEECDIETKLTLILYKDLILLDFKNQPSNRTFNLRFEGCSGLFGNISYIFFNI